MKITAETMRELNAILLKIKNDKEKQIILKYHSQKENSNLSKKLKIR